MENEHIVSAFDDEFKKLDSLIAEMGGLVENSILLSTKAFSNRVPEEAEQIILQDKKIDALEVEIDNTAIRMIAQRQPMAKDLRIIIVCLKISHNLERIGDYCKNIAKRTIAISKGKTIPTGADKAMLNMSEVVQEMLRNSLDSFLNRNIDTASDVIERDDHVDNLYSGSFRELLTYMMEDPRNISNCTHLMFISKNLERMGDHITNIAEYIHFMMTGSLPDSDRAIEREDLM